MVYKALYRTYRPQKFSEVIGQGHIVRTLQNSIINNKTSHAYLFSGPRGTGKTSVARIFSKALNCTSSEEKEPCGKCLSCQEIAKGMSPDVVEIDAASNNGVDEIREIRDKVKFLPGGAKYKIYIIDEVHMLSQGAFNALLKTLEEPPKHVIFILATTEPHKVIPTILSRCQRFDFKTLNVQEISSMIKSVSLREGFDISDEAVLTIAESAEGGMRDALSFLDQAASFTDGKISIDDVNSVTGNLNFDKIIELAKYFEDKNINKALKTINELVIMGKEINKIVSSLLQFYRDCLLYKNTDVSMFSKYIFEKEDFKELAPKLDVDKIFYYIDVLSDVQSKIKVSTTPTIYLEVATIKMINSNAEDFSYNKRINELEEKLNAVSNGSNDGNQIEVNGDKVDSIEKRLNKVIHELSRLELHKLIEKVDVIEKSTQDESGPKLSSETNLDKFEEEFLLFKQKLLDLETSIKSAALIQGDFNNDFYKVDNDIKRLKNEVNVIKDNLENKNLGKNNSSDDIEEIKDELNDIYLNKFSTIESKLNEIKSKSDSSSATNVNDNLKYEFDRIKEKINSIESKVYRLISGELEKTQTKKIRTKINRKQIGLFGDEIVNLKDFNKPIKEVVDFNIKKIENDIIEEESLVQNPSTDEDFNLKQEILVDKDTNQEDLIISDNTEETGDEEDYQIINIEKDDLSKVEDRIIKAIKTDSEEIIEREKSSLVRRLNTQPQPALNDKEELIYEKKEEEKEEFVTTTRDYTPPTNMADDEFSNYDVKVLERILHDSRSEESRKDKTRIINLWKNLVRSVPKAQSHIVTLLQDGKLVATGKKEFVIVYPNAALCNQVMRLSFKKDSLKLLYDFLGDTYNYFAIPESIWLEKRTEYINQYNIGTRFPKLTPIENSGLNVLEDNKEYINKQETSRSKAISFFGEELVKVE